MSENKITTLFLDIGGVLLSDGWGHQFRQQAADKFNLDYAEMNQRHRLLFVVYEEGRITLDEYLDRVVFYQERGFTPSQFKDFMFSLTTADTNMITLIKQLKATYQLKIIVVSNEAKELNEYRIQKFQLNLLIDFFISSCYVHVRKPDEAIFKIALNGVQVPANEIVYIDDVQMFTEIATGIGIRSIWHKDHLSTAKELAKLGLPIE
ncbi:HAD-IA family hydrolase [Ferruginibacter sp.]|uniref:HAD-IA family hydrolase n=1 Tax=Ferruginibacter sp. TaxID=1940288 RepID=UPI00265A4E6A|nr:HAD-IA family hydrolase [Ferruginibacter sp.]